MDLALAADVFSTAVLRDIRHESAEICDPGIVPIPLDEVDMRILIPLPELVTVANTH